MLRIVLLICVSSLLFSCQEKEVKVISLPYYNSPDFTPFFLEKKNQVEVKILHKINEFEFLNQEGKTISRDGLKGKIHIANFMFTSCGSICPSMTKNLKKVSNAFKENQNVILLSFSVTPWIDSIPKLKNYKESNGIENPNWHFLTGNKSDIYTLARKSYFAEEELGFTKDSTDFLHTEHFLLIDQNLRIRGIYNGTLTLEMEQLIKDIQSLDQAI